MAVKLREHIDNRCRRLPPRRRTTDSAANASLTCDGIFSFDYHPRRKTDKNQCGCERNIRLLSCHIYCISGFCSAFLIHSIVSPFSFDWQPMECRKLHSGLILIHNGFYCPIGRKIDFLTQKRYICPSSRLQPITRRHNVPCVLGQSLHGCCSPNLP